MTVLLDFTAPRSLDALVARLLANPPTGPVEAWLFEDRAARSAAEMKLAEAGIASRIRSAYKPLVHFFLEEAPIARQSVDIIYPMLQQAAAKRFVLEAFPLAGLLGGIAPSFAAKDMNTPVYKVSIDGAQIEVFAPNRVHTDHGGETVLSPTGWLRIAADGVDERIETDFEQVYDKAMVAIATHDFGTTAPLFEELNIRVTLPAVDHKMPVGEEAISLAEAMHEDLYFSVMEIFQERLGSGRNDYHGRPGQIVPQVGHTSGGSSVRVETRPLSAGEASVPHQPLDTATHPLGVSQIHAEIGRLGGEPTHARSRAGRVLPGIYKPGSDRGVIISGGQHANETTGIIGALRGAGALAERADSHFAVSPLENPDGYALHHRLRAEHAGHMHHAARYTGLGDDVESRGDTPILESMIRREQLDRMDARLHINLHGYPAHEWTRPLSGYLPRGFELWTLPKGFFIIVRHHEGWEDAAEQLIHGVVDRLVEVPGLVEYNRRQIDLYTAHAGPPEAFRIIRDFPVWSGSQFRHDVPLTLITEFPDETIYGDEFVLGHTAQMATVVGAYDAYQTLTLPEEPVRRGA